VNLVRAGYLMSCFVVQIPAAHTNWNVKLIWEPTVRGRVRTGGFVPAAKISLAEAGSVGVREVIYVNAY